jgi:hypothetical protein
MIEILLNNVFYPRRDIYGTFPWQMIYVTGNFGRMNVFPCPVLSGYFKNTL